MRKIKFMFLLGLFWMVSLGSSAYDFSAVNADGVTIYYNITSSKDLTCEVTYDRLILESTAYSGIGIVNIPKSVSYNSKTYSVTSIGKDAFYNVRDLTSVTIPNSVTSIGGDAFHSCTGLTSVTIPNSVTSIGGSAFGSCRGLTSVTIPNSVTSIGSAAFQNCSGLTAVNITDIDKWAEIEFGSDDANPLFCAKKLYLNGELVTDAKLTSATKIGSYAFDGCSGLTSIEIPNSVTSIGRCAFSSCSGLTSIVVESGNTKYDSRNNCNAIIKTATNTLITGCMNSIIPNSVTSIGDRAFYYCSGLTSITIGNSVTSIGDYAFYYCSDLTSIEIPNSVTSIGSYAFEYCRGLTSVTIPNSVTRITSCAFECCSGLTSVTIPNSVTNIEYHAFSNCSGLTSVTIGNSVTSIGDAAFYNCSLKSVTMKATTPPTCGRDVFIYITSSATLTVPVGCVLTYKKAKPWKNFGTITDGEVQFPTMSVTKEEITPTAFAFKLNYNKEKCIPFTETGVECDGSYYKANSEGIVKLDLEPSKYIYVYPYAKYGGVYYVSESGISASAKSLNSKITVSDIKANKAYIRGVYDIGVVQVDKATFKVSSTDDDYEIKEQEIKNDKFSLTGLVPNTKYEVVYTVYYHYGEGDKKSGSESKTQNITTADLKMLTLNPRNVSSTSSVVAAEANISDDETGAGFEWRKYDAPESLPSSKGSAIVYDGRMEGKINNLQTTYYNVRPFYKSASGKVFYGEWITFDPTDFSYFEPTVHTYDMIEDPSANSVEVRGYVMQGTDDVTEQGFEYWTTSSSSLMKMASNGEVMRVQATGQMMIATLKDLDYESNYVVRAYVVTARGTVYGEERTFTTPENPTSGISEVKESESVSRSLKGIYTLDGRKIERITTPGIYIYNGKKVMFKAGQLPVE